MKEVKRDEAWRSPPKELTRSWRQMVAGEDYSANLRCCRFARVQRSLRLVGVVRESRIYTALALTRNINARAVERDPLWC